MRYITVLSIACLLLVGCAKSPPNTNALDTAAPAALSGSPNLSDTANQPAPPGSAPLSVTTREGKVEICDLLASKDLQTGLGETLKEAFPSARSEGGFRISQCVYSLSPTTNTITVLVAQRAESAGARDPKEFWDETFRHGGEEAKVRAQQKDGAKAGSMPEARGNENIRAVPPQQISGLGDDSYWTGNRVGGALYVLKENTYFRISVGGPGDQAAKIKKSTALAQIVLKQL